MKSLADVALVTAASLITVIGIYSFSLGYELQSLGRDTTNRAVIESIGQMEFVKSALDHSVVYSTYQGAYETLNGKYDIQGCDPQRGADNIPFWRVNDKTCQPDTFQNSLESNTKSIFNEYYTPLKELSSKVRIELPSYQLQFSTSSFTLQAIADKRLEFNSDKIKINDVGDRIFDSGFLVNDYIDTAKEKFINQDPVKTQVSLAEQALVNCRQISDVQTKSGRFPQSSFTFLTKEQILLKYCPNILNIFKNTIVTNVNSLSTGLDTERVRVNVQTIPDFVKTVVDDKDESTCSVTGDTYCIREEVFEQPCPTTTEPDKICISIECVAEETTFTKTCTYNYNSGADALVSISNKFSDKVPVYDSLEKKTTEKDVRLVFWDRVGVQSSLPDRRLLPEIILPSKETPVPSGNYIQPIDNGVVTSCFGFRTSPLDDTQTQSDFHTGIDFSNSGIENKPSYAVTSGTVEKTCTVSPFSEGAKLIARLPFLQALKKIAELPCGFPGNYVMTKNNDGLYTVYAHMNSVSVKQGDKVTQGQQIGTVGNTGASTGPHLHLEIREDSNIGFKSGSLNGCNYVSCGGSCSSSPNRG